MKTKGFIKRFSTEQGTSMMELILVLPLLLMVPIASMDLTRNMKQAQAVLTVQEYASQLAFKKCVYQLEYTPDPFGPPGSYIEDVPLIQTETQDCLTENLKGGPSDPTIGDVISRSRINVLGQPQPLMLGQVFLIATVYRHSGLGNDCYQVTKYPTNPSPGSTLSLTASCDIRTSAGNKIILPAAMLAIRKKVVVIEGIRRGNYLGGFFTGATYETRTYSVL